MSEYTSKRVASLAARVLSGYEPTASEVRSLAASALTQARDNDDKGYTADTYQDVYMNGVRVGACTMFAVCALVALIVAFAI